MAAHKAILRASGLKDLHDEEAIYATEVRDARAAGRSSGAIDAYGFAVSFKSVLLEGLEVAFIALTFGANQGNVGLAAVAALSAVVVVATAGLAARAPLSRVPENTLKFGVGVMLTAFGTFWSVEGAGATWPGGDLAIPVLIVSIALLSVTFVELLGRPRSRAASR